MITKRPKKKSYDWDVVISIGLIVFVNVAIILFLAVGNVRLFIKKHDMSAQLVDLTQEVQKLAQKNEELDKIFYESTQEEYTEEVMREEGQYKKPGEEVVVIVGDDQNQPVPVIEKKGFWQRVSDFFSSIFSR